MNPVDIVIRQARLRATGSLMDIANAGGVITAIGAHLEARAGLELEARGGLVTEAFVNPHLHLCKVYTRALLDEEALTGYHAEGMGQAMTIIELAARVKEKYSAAWLLPNIRRAVALAATHGNTHIRALADVDSKARLEGVKALLARHQPGPAGGARDARGPEPGTLRRWCARVDTAGGAIRGQGGLT